MQLSFSIFNNLKENVTKEKKLFLSWDCTEKSGRVILCAVKFCHGA